MRRATGVDDILSIRYGRYARGVNPYLTQRLVREVEFRSLWLAFLCLGDRECVIATP
jgi:hypothetical protein